MSCSQQPHEQDPTMAVAQMEETTPLQELKSLQFGPNQSTVETPDDSLKATAEKQVPQGKKKNKKRKKEKIS